MHLINAVFILSTSKIKQKYNKIIYLLNLILSFFYLFIYLFIYAFTFAFIASTRLLTINLNKPQNIF